MRLMLLAPLLLACVASVASVASAQPARAASAAAAPAKYPGFTWGQEPVETLSSTRAQICLNGRWRFVPATGDNAAKPRDWGAIWVPGTWGGARSYLLPGIAQRGQGADWPEPLVNQASPNGPKIDPLKNLGRAWYGRPLSIPAGWAGRSIRLDFARISTDAQVLVNGIDCGRVVSPYGSVDVTKAVAPGAEATLQVLVVASNDKATEQVFMGTAENQVYNAATDLDTRGITGDVMLTSEPRGARISDVFVQPSTRKQQMKLSIELSDVAQAGTVTISGRCLDEKGQAEKTFSQQIVVKAGAQAVQVLVPWASPKLWDFGQPNLYTLMLRAEGAGLSDEYAQEFGFREFWIEGKRFMLNGSEMRLRPTALGNEANRDFLMREEVDGAIDGLRATGFNIQEFWPFDRLKRGVVADDRLFYSRADARGWPLIGALPAMSGPAANWSEAGVRQAWASKAEVELRRHRNHPSILMWVHSPNRFGNWQDQNPRLVGNKPRLGQVKDGSTKILPAALDANAIVQAIDPTRPISTHQGGVAGGWQMTNNYLNFMPFQEQEEWLSDWAQNGTEPYMPVEFGFILGCDLRRGRNTGGWGRWGATATEDLATEFLAMFYGREAYAQESAAHKALHEQRFVKSLEDAPANLKAAYAANKGQVYREREVIDPLARQMEADAARRNYRSWRTMGSTGGAILWEAASSPYNTGSRERVDVGPFVPGRRGVYRQFVSRGRIAAARSEADLRNPILNQALISADSETLAWIVGPDVAGDFAAFTAKDHSLRAGQSVSKRLALLNDTRAPQDYAASWSVSVGGRQLSQGSKSGRLSVAQTLFVPLSFALPSVTSKTDAKIEMSAQVGAQKHTDSFSLRVFPTLAPARQAVTIFDPVGKTTAMLRALGYFPSTWGGGATPNLLIIGREAMTSAAKLPGDLQAFVRNGGRALVMEQQPDYLRRLGFRVGSQVRREVYAVSDAHPVAAGLDASDLRDWAGSSTLVPPRPEVTDKDKSSMGYPVHGWRWSNRGGVSCAMIEKPHRSGWRPILEGDFDLAYTPLMELELGRGRVTLCTLDLEDHVSADAAAERLASNILSYARTAPIKAKAERVSYLGTGDGSASDKAFNEEGEEKLRRLGIVFQTVTSIPQSPGVLILRHADEFSLHTSDIRRFCEAGGQILVLPETHVQRNVGQLIDYGLPEAANFTGSLNVPNWDVCAGLSPSDLRYRAPRATPVFPPGVTMGERGADGLLARIKFGKGEVIFSQLDPDRFEADNLTYFRLTRWRQTRALAQILSNMGATFESDAEFFISDKPVTRLSLAGSWKAAQTAPIALTKAAVPDPGFSQKARDMVAPGFNDSSMATVAVPGAWEKLGGNWASQDGEAVLRRAVEVPAAWAGQDLALSLGTIDDLDNTFWNGEEVGRTDASIAAPYSISRRYTIPGRLVQAGRNVLAVRIFDAFSDDGFTSAQGELSLALASAQKQPGGFYHPDYRSDFALGDDPHRYYRW